jgi:arabinofuranosyltransferase
MDFQVALPESVQIRFPSGKAFSFDMRSALSGLGCLLVFALFILTFVKTAWVTEDAFITFRVVDNALNGHGLSWNPNERVQAYTHPLWFFLLLAGSAINNQPYYISLFLSYICIVTTLWLALKILRPCGALSFLFLFALLFSKAFIDWMTSGLENPLGYLLITLFLWIWFRKEGNRHHLFLLTFTAGAMYLNRPDAIVLISPALLYAFLTDEHPWRKKIGIVLMGGMGVFAWTLFSLVYYGTPVPNTALAKTATDIPALQYLAQAALTYAHIARTDTVSLILLLAGCLIGFLQSPRRWKALSAGLPVWGIYLCMIGGDYMAGRFFSIPVLFSALLCARALRNYPFRKLGAAVVAAMLIALPQLQFTLFSTLDYRIEGRIYDITDSRGAYYRATGLLRILQNTPGGGGISHRWFLTGKALKDAAPRKGIYTGCVMGMLPYGAGPDFYWIDPLALSNAFLARLPARSGSRVGHYERALPPGYLESVMTEQNHIADPALARLYSDVLLASTGKIFRRERFAAIFRLNTGFHKNAAANYDREAIGLPGLSVATKETHSCHGRKARGYHVDESLRTLSLSRLLGSSYPN